uniref:preprotein translocase subunit SecA n=2 Tax=unclassified Psychrobacter TaxID=196806 RepID=UPI0025D0E629
TPLIISGPLEDRSDFYNLIDTFIPALEPEDFEIDEKQKTAIFTEVGTEKVEQLLDAAGHLKGESLYDIENVAIVHHLNNALRAHKLFQRDKDYIVRNDEIVIIDEFTGRMMPGRRYSEGLHQALEAKEKVTIQPENQTLASITFQNYFRMYTKLSGMTGTAATEAEEFGNIYGLEVLEIPTNLPVKRIDEDDEVYRTVEEKYKAIVKDIHASHAKGQPVLVGTTSIEKSELLAERLRKEGVKDFQVLNARYHEQEAFIIAQAGVPGAVTIATNMAGRGTDIILGGNWQSFIEDIDAVSPEEMARLKAEWQVKHDQVVAAGGLHIIGSERHESRRIDNQLRGRAGRQGDPGMSRFFLSLEDDLMRIFAGDRVVNMMRAMGLKEDEAIEHKMVSKSIENAQGKVESRDFDARKNLLKYDDVANEQRKVIYGQRDDLLAEMDLLEAIEVMHHEVYNAMIDQFIPPGSIDDQWNIDGLEDELEDEFKISMPINDWLDEDRRLDEEGLRAKIIQTALDRYHARREQMGEKDAAQLERHFMLQSLDKHWKEHLTQMDQLRKGIHLRGYAQKNPEQEYKRESFELFQMMLGAIKSETVQDLSRVHIPTKEELEALEAQQRENAAHMQMQFEHSDIDNMDGGVERPAAQNRSVAAGVTAGSIAGSGTNNASEPNPYAGMNISRNAPCPCGSGLKYKQCHGKI